MTTPGKAALLVVALATSAFAAATVNQSVQPQELGVEDVAQVVVEVSGANSQAQVSLPSEGDFEILGRSSSMSTSIRDDGTGAPVIERTQRFIFTIQPRRVGEVTIPAAQVRVGGSVLAGAPTTLEVSKGRRAQPQRAARTNDPFASLFGGDPFAGMGGDPFAGMRGGSLFDRFFNDMQEEAPRPFDAKLFVSVDKDTVYAGEQATVSVYLATRSNLRDVGSLHLPTIDGAASQDIDLGKRLTPRPMTLGGREYQGYLVARRAIFPSAAGTLSIPQASIEVSGGGPVRTLRSSSVTLEVKAVPPGGSAGEPVGEWDVSASISSKGSPQVGQPIPVQVVVEGTGDLKAVPEPVLELEGSARVLPPTVEDTPSVRGTRLGGKRIYEFLVMPDAPGVLLLPAVKVPYFNPSTGRHEVAASTPLHLDVAPAPGAQPVAAAAPPVAPPEVPAPVAAAPSWKLPRLALEVAGTLAVLGLLGVGVWRWRKSAPAGAPSTRAQRRRAARTLASAHSAAKSGQQAEAIRLAESALTTIAQASGLSPESVDIDWVANDATRPSSAAWAQTMLRCRRARFMKLEPELVSDILARADQTLVDLPRQPPPAAGAAHA